MSINIELNSKEVNNILCLNIIKMLNRRNLIDDVDKKFSEISSDINQKSIIEFKLNDGTKCSIYPINAKLSSITQGTPIDEYLSNNLDIHKIIVIKECAKKVFKQVITDYKNSEIFFEHEMLEDIPLKAIIPSHQLLSPEEKEEVLSKFPENELSKIFDTEMMSRYYNAKVGDIFKIVRASKSGNSIFYRRVINGSLDLIFD
uniref:RNA polymerase subunit H/Rpb5 C-terminal domain-containing protein n=1 Tax=viral metagenome TaxID=1070528 RepID=A0A6C0D9W4_9ZZZZ